MSYSFKIEVPSGIWKAAGEEAIIRRIAKTVYGSDEGVKPNGHGAWHLKESANDWWVMKLNETNGIIEFEVGYRYGGGGNKPMMFALETFLNWIFES